MRYEVCHLDWDCEILCVDSHCLSRRGALFGHVTCNHKVLTRDVRPTPCLFFCAGGAAFAITLQTTNANKQSSRRRTSAISSTSSMGGTENKSCAEKPENPAPGICCTMVAAWRERQKISLPHLIWKSVKLNSTRASAREPRCFYSQRALSAVIAPPSLELCQKRTDRRWCLLKCVRPTVQCGSNRPVWIHQLSRLYDRSKAYQSTFTASCIWGAVGCSCSSVLSHGFTVSVRGTSRTVLNHHQLTAANVETAVPAFVRQCFSGEYKLLLNPSARVISFRTFIFVENWIISTRRIMAEKVEKQLGKSPRGLNSLATSFEFAAYGFRKKF